MKARILIACTLLLSLTACSGIKFAYNSLERLSLFKLDDYLELSSSDKKELRAQLSGWKDQKLLTTLPDLAHQLEEWDQTFQKNELTQTEAKRLLRNLDDMTKDLRTSLAQEAFQFLSKMDDSQKQKVVEKIKERLEKKDKTISSPEKLQNKTEQRFRRTMNRFFDGIEPGQYELIERLQTEAKEEYILSLACQREWLNKFEGALRSEEGSDLEEFLISFFSDQRDISSDMCKEFLKDRWQRWAHTISEVHGALTLEQKEFFSKRMQKWRTDLKEIVEENSSH